MNQDLIAQMVVQEEAARLLVYRAACLADRGRPYNLEVSIAKYAAAEAAALVPTPRSKSSALTVIQLSFPWSAIFAMPSPIRSSKDR
jgi:hypothetical protein